MSDRSISLITILATIFWATGTSVIVCSVFHGTAQWGNLGLLGVAVAMMLNLRQFFCRMEVRERQAFDLGREAANMRAVR